jgi:hypothetical protein
MKSSSNYLLVFFGLLVAGAFLTQSTYAFNLRKQLVQTTSNLQETLAKNTSIPSATPIVTLPPTTIPTASLIPTLLPTPTEAPTQEIVYVTKTKTIYVNVTPTATPTATPTPTPTTTPTPTPTPTPEHVFWQIRANGGNIVCRYPGNGDSLGVTIRSDNYPDTADYVFEMPKTLDFEYSIMSEEDVELTGECYDFSAYDGDSFTNNEFYGISFERYPYMIDEVFEFIPNGAGQENEYVPGVLDDTWTVWFVFPS